LKIIEKIRHDFFDNLIKRFIYIFNTDFSYSMKPNVEEFTNNKIPMTKSQESNYKLEVVWKNVVFFIYIHLASLYALYSVFEFKFWTIVCGTYLIYLFPYIDNCDLFGTIGYIFFYTA